MPGSRPDLITAVEHPGHGADPDPGVRGHVRDGDPAPRGPARGFLEALPVRRGLVAAEPDRTARIGSLRPGGALAEPEDGWHHLPGGLVRPEVQLPQHPVDHPAGDLLDRDDGTGQPRVQQGGGGASVEAGDAEIAADPQPQLGGDRVDHGGQPVAAGHDGAGPGRRARSRPGARR